MSQVSPDSLQSQSPAASHSNTTTAATSGATATVSNASVSSFCTHRFKPLAVYFADLTIDELLMTIHSLTLERFIGIVVIEKNLRALATIFLLDLVTSKWSCGLKIPKAVVKLETADRANIPNQYIKDVIRENIPTLQEINLSNSHIDNVFMEELVQVFQEVGLQRKLHCIQTSDNPDFTNPQIKKQLHEFFERVIA